MLENRVKKKIARNETAFGVMVSWACPDMIEFFGYLGFDWIFIDAEHGVIGRDACVELVRACNLTGLTPIVRVPDKSEGTILGYLETGVLGVIVPHTNSSADARAAVNAIKYSPVGKRGAGSTTRVANFGLTQTPTEYFRLANEETIVSALVEEAEGLRHLDEIMAVQGIDSVGIGAGDLAMTLGLPGQANHPDVRKLVVDAEARVIAAGKVLDSVVRDASEAREAASRGSRLIAIPAGSLLGSAGRAFLTEVKR
jgi:2-keto-3-deoxy-L-rhamnonate aldolase RhmA